VPQEEADVPEQTTDAQTEGLALEDWLTSEGVPLKDPEAIRMAVDVEQRVHELIVERTAKQRLQPPPKEVDVTTLGITAAQMLVGGLPEVKWLVPNLLGPDWIGKISGREKAGKSVLMFIAALGPLERGEPTVFGPATEPATALIYSEEPEDGLLEKINDAGLRNATIVYTHQLGGHTWKEKVNVLVAVAKHRGHKLIFMDNFSRAAEIEDENGPEMGRAAEYLAERAKAAELAVLILHHNRKATGNVFDLSRGGTALGAACDINIVLQEVAGPDDRRRKLTSRGRLKATNWVKTALLSEDGTAYTLVDNEPEGVDTATQNAVLTRTYLEQVGATTARQFVEAQGGSTDTATRRLDDLVKEGWAEAERHRGRPTVWTAVPRS
jgi:hypothetical protein